MVWYADGSIQVAANGTVATGTGTAFLKNVRIGDGLVIAGSTAMHEVIGVASDTSLSFQPPYAGAAGAGKAYRVAPMLGYDKDLSDAFNAIRLQLGTFANNPNLNALAAAVGAANKGLMFTAPGAIGTFDLTAQARTFLAAASLVQQRIALGLVPQNASADAAEGALLVQRSNGGSWGLGSSAATDSSAANTDIRTYSNTRFFANGGQHNPALENKTELQFSSGLFISGGPSIQASMVIGYGVAARMAFLSKLNGSTWNPVRMLWDDNSLAKAVNATANNGEVWTQHSSNGMYGLGGWGMARDSRAAIESARPSELFRIASNDSAINPYNNSAVGVHISYAAGNSYAMQIAGSVSVANRFYGRSYVNGVWNAPVEFWHSVSLAKQANVTDATPGAVVINGGWGVGARSIPRTAAQSNADRPTEFFDNSGTDTVFIGPGCGIHMQHRTAGYGLQLYGGVTADALQYRRLNNGSWGSVVRVWDSVSLTPNKLEERTQATLPTAASNYGQMFLCSNTARGVRPVYSSGPQWRYIEDNALITAA